MSGAILGLLKLLVLAPWYFIKIRFLNPTPEPSEVKNVGLFHIPAHANGGGEKVLWAIVNKLVEEKQYKIHIYSDVVNKEEMLQKVNRFFGYNLKPDDFNLIQLEDGYLTYSDHWTIFSRYLEGLTHYLVAFQALDKFMPDIFVETFTAHFSPIAVKLLNPNVKVITYVHYPYTSPQVISEYWDGMMDSARGIKARLFSGLKLGYHYGLYLLYKLMGYFNDVCYTNSSWTQRHMVGNWGDKCQVLYPPCSVDEFWSQDYNNKKRTVVSLGQYRPEKRHDIQLDMMKYHLEKNPKSDVVFKIMGSGKFEESEKIFRHLQDRVKKEKIRNVELLKDLKFSELMTNIKEATFGVHTMIDEHFGISVVEMLSGGLITLAHNSAGPKDDILGNHTHALYGLLANDDKDFNVTFNQMIEDYGVPAKREALLAKVKAGQKFAREQLSNEAFASKFVKKIHDFDKEFRVRADERKKEEEKRKKEEQKNAKKGTGDL